MAVWAIIENHGKILFTKRSANDRRAGQWCLPGGRVHKLESLADACYREVIEEVGVKIHIIKPHFELDGEYYFQCALDDPNSKIILKENECEDYKWAYPKEVEKIGNLMNYKVLKGALAYFGYI